MNLFNDHFPVELSGRRHLYNPALNGIFSYYPERFIMVQFCYELTIHGLIQSCLDRYIYARKTPDQVGVLEWFYMVAITNTFCGNRFVLLIFAEPTPFFRVSFLE